jgi:ubiquinone/menaquinone biosynthesis C-methylase UbiE
MGFYDWLCDKMASGPDMEKARQKFLEDARGRTLEVGFGTGLNAPFYGGEVERVTGIEPSAGAEKRARKRIAEAKVPIEWKQGRGEELPFEDASFDTVVTTLVLCTKTGDPQAILSEISRVLKPTGRFLFWEHGHSADPKAQKLQRRLNGVHKLVMGCRLDAPIRVLIEGAGFRFERIEDFVLPKQPPFIHMVQGVAARN